MVPEASPPAGVVATGSTPPNRTGCPLLSGLGEGGLLEDAHEVSLGDGAAVEGDQRVDHFLRVRFCQVVLHTENTEDKQEVVGSNPGEDK